MLRRVRYVQIDAGDQYRIDLVDSALKTLNACTRLFPMFTRQSDVRKRGRVVPMFTRQSDVRKRGQVVPIFTR